MNRQQGPDPYSPHTGSGAYHVVHYELDLSCKLGGNRLDGTATLQVEALLPCTQLELDLVGLGVTRTSVGGRKSPHKRRGGKLIIELPTPLAPGELTTVQVRYGGTPGPRQGPWGDVGWEELEDGVLVAGQPDGATTWFPCNDTPGDKASYRISVETDAGYRPVANGRLVSHSRRSSRERWEFVMDAPMAPYLATLQIGRYTPQPLEAGMSVMCPAEMLDDARVAFAQQGRMRVAFESEFGAYPFEAYTAVVTQDELEIPLEAQGLSIFGRNHLSTTWEAQRLIAHEYAHQWFGNSLTVHTWKDVWLHEGFACFSEWLWSERSGGQSIQSRAKAAWRGLSSLPQDIVVGDPGPKLMFDDRVYKRGALAVYALREACGAEAFRGLLHSWTQENRHGTIDREAFDAHLVAHSPEGVYLTQILSEWVDTRALPAFPAGG